MPEAAVSVVVAAIVTGLASLVVSIVTLVTGSRTARRQIEAAQKAVDSQRRHELDVELRQQRQAQHASLLALLNPSSLQTMHISQLDLPSRRSLHSRPRRYCAAIR